MKNFPQEIDCVKPEFPIVRQCILLPIWYSCMIISLEWNLHDLYKNTHTSSYRHPIEWHIFRNDQLHFVSAILKIIFYFIFLWNFNWCCFFFFFFFCFLHFLNWPTKLNLNILNVKMMAFNRVKWAMFIHFVQKEKACQNILNDWAKAFM